MYIQIGGDVDKVKDQKWWGFDKLEVIAKLDAEKMETNALVGFCPGSSVI